ncbi:N-acetyltransferase [Agrobacterium tumefaciens]|uniref:GNAT family N-acetyltransferase n=1 Tax=Agrobacterium TaxID=357 RepID=UPI00115ECF91|nr:MULTISPECIES: GNAT family N-acetyltransferase [Agrobacterium]MDA5245225.1 GNAT family N-acetyltransferase [Agrobacterium sp. MAFF310724]MDA5246346.1 GNAT family N-acetyltransferase [Agrobacterium sp. MAFF210268]TRB17540.1 N-acetyltransferase [Agrobacterium tumefaciens]
MQASLIDIQTFQPDHLDAAVELSRQASWPHRKEDWALVLSLSKGFVALENGRVVGTAMATILGDTCATVNMVIVDESMRGRGLGRQLMGAALDAAENRECRLVATADGLPLYEKLGFAACGEVLQHQGIPAATDRPEGVTWAETIDPAELAALDAQAFGADRTALFAALADRARFALVQEHGVIKGFAALRAFGRGEVIGPVVAENAEIAKDLIAFVFSERPGAFLRVDTTADTGLAPWLAERGLGHVGGGIAMRRSKTEIPADKKLKTFALTSQALG